MRCGGEDRIDDGRWMYCTGSGVGEYDRHSFSFVSFPFSFIREKNK